MFVNRKMLKNLDSTFAICVALVLVISLVVLSSASGSMAEINKLSRWHFVERQAIWIGLGLLCIYFMLFVDYTILPRYVKYLYGINIVLLLAVFVMGKVAKGAKLWVSIGGFQFQPAEFAKLLIIITFAEFLVKRQGKLNTWRELLPAFIHVGIPLLLVLAQPDLGTSLVFIAIMFGMLYIAGARPSLLLILIFSGLLVVTLALVGHFKFGLPLPLDEYQKYRLIVFLNPYNDGYGGRGAGWNMIQSLVAIGSGGLFGKGLFKGTQGQLNFLPEHHTDFIFSVVGEELGFLGAAVLLVLYFLIIYRALRIAIESKDLFGTFIAVGVASMWGFHILENIGMAIGIMPITGIPLPFLSYGGSFMLTNLLAVGLLLNINIRRQKVIF